MSYLDLVYEKSFEHGVRHARLLDCGCTRQTVKSSLDRADRQAEARLGDQGVLTYEEFESKKGELLARTSGSRRLTEAYG